MAREAPARAAQQQRELGNMHTHVQLLHIVLTIVDLRFAIILFLCVGILGWELHICRNSGDGRAGQHVLLDHVAVLAALVWGMRTHLE